MCVQRTVIYELPEYLAGWCRCTESRAKSYVARSSAAICRRLNASCYKRHSWPWVNLMGGGASNRKPRCIAVVVVVVVIIIIIFL
jgi:hypothetical protein